MIDKTFRLLLAAAFFIAGAPPFRAYTCEATPLPRSEIVVRGRADHPCVNLTPSDVEHALERVDQYAWAKILNDGIIKTADGWLRESDEYWIEFLPEPGACYAYGFTGDPITGERLGGYWIGASCDWEHPRQVINPNGRPLPDEEYPDDGTGYTAPDGRVHYFVGIFNAWVTEQWTLRALPALSKAYLLTGDERYADRGVLLLDALASIYSESTSGSWDYPSNPPSGRFARPWYQVARTLVKYVDYYDFMVRSPAMDEPSKRPGMTRRENIEKHLLLDGAYYCYVHGFDGGLHNGHADYVRGALAVGCVLDIPEYIRNALDSPFSIHSMLANNIDRDGRYYESSLGYAIHARGLYLTYADPLLNLRNEEYPMGLNLYDDPRMQSCLFLPELQVELAGRRPNFGDSAPDFSHKPFPEDHYFSVDHLYLERLYAMTSDPERKKNYGAALNFLAKGKIDEKRAALNNDWLLWHADEPPQEKPALPAEFAPRITGSWVAGMKGMALLRSEDQAVLLRYGPSLTHGDPDDLGLLYYANGYEFTYDLGYGLGSTHVHCGWASSTASHCLVTVDETNQLGGEGGGGSLLFFADLPGVKVVEAESANSYSELGVTEYRRTVALMTDGKYLVDLFRVKGGSQHDYGFGSIGTDLTPFGVPDLGPHEGSLAEGVAWAHKIGNDGDIIGYPNKPYWKPPPQNGYGFFFDVKRGAPDPVWGGTWSIPGKVPTRMRMHVLGDADEAITASAPGLYPSKPLSSYVLARRAATGAGPLESSFISIYEPFVNDATGTPAPVIDSVQRLGSASLQVNRTDGAVEILIAESAAMDTPYGPMSFKGDFALLTGDGRTVHKVESVGCAFLEIDGKAIELPPSVFEAIVTEVDPVQCIVLLDQPVPEGLDGQAAVFSNPLYSRTTAYHVMSATANRIRLQANSLVLGKGRVQTIHGPKSFTSDIPHEYTWTMPRKHSTRFFDGKRILGETGGAARVVQVGIGKTLRVDVDEDIAWPLGETFEYIDLSPGDKVRIAVPRVHRLAE